MLVWALIGIAVRLHETTAILVVALAGAAALAVNVLVITLRNRTGQRRNLGSSAPSSSSNA